MQELGAVLRRARQARGLTPEDLHARTKISMHLLVAMEAGRFEELPGHTYCRAFLRLYAREVGLEQQEVLAMYESALRPPAPLATPPTTTHDETRSRRSRAKRRRVGGWFLAAALLVTLLLLRWYFAGRPAEPPRPEQNGAPPPSRPDDGLEGQPGLPELTPVPLAFDDQVRETPMPLPDAFGGSEATETLYTGRQTD